MKIKTLRDGKKTELTALLGKAKPQYGYSWREGEAYDQLIEQMQRSTYNLKEQLKTQNQQEAYNRLKEELKRLNKEMERLNREMARLKQEKSKE